MHVTPDLPIFGVGSVEATAFRWYFGTEVDRKTEPLRTKSNARKSISSMFKRMLEIDSLGLAQTLYVLPVFYFPVVTTNATRMQS